MNYDDAVRLASAESAKTPNSVVIQDTAWEGYEEIPGWIMQGYGTMAMEAAEQLAELGVRRPTHIFVQAGVGSLAGAVQGFFANRHPDNVPVTAVVEAAAADCLYRSAVKADGSAVNVPGDLVTIMAGLACGEANTISWEILKSKSSFFVSLPDYAAAWAMRVLGAPIAGDPRVVSGESGAAGAGLLLDVLRNPARKALREALGLNAESRVLLFSTEGDTDPDQYRRIVWEGEYPVPFGK
jgi:diaminopropionate ammonia-lyase